MMEDRKEDKEDSRHSRGLKGEDFFLSSAPQRSCQMYLGD